MKNRKFVIVEGDRLYSYEERKVTMLKQVSSKSVQDCRDVLNKDVSFIKKVRTGLF